MKANILKEFRLSPKPSRTQRNFKRKIHASIRVIIVAYRMVLIIQSSL